MTDNYTIEDMVSDAHNDAKEKGWWPDDKEANVAEKLALIHSEISEALEDVRNGRMTTYDSNGKPDGFPIELADAVIRIADLCGYLGIDLEYAIMLKMAYNRTRPYRHGGKLI